MGRHSEDMSQRAEQLAQRFLAHELPTRWAHTCGVIREVKSLSAHLPEEQRETLATAAALHDIGYARPLALTGFHPIDGARYCALTGFPASVVGLVAHHTGARYEAEERKLGKLHSEYPVPPADLLAVLSCADLSTSPLGDPVEPEARIQEVLRRYTNSDPVHRAIQRSKAELLASARQIRRGNAGLVAMENAS
ncbi:HD domain-containing protein [Mycobacteroides abscessus]|uniref:HD domain-containing protein n=1 Tax=Mycobacteroides abscessus TaxID=36809 RepID=UPI0009D18D00|nr:HD domain-containing protein [Mycobacteroides abscessus]SLH40810.1 metal dependent phosphohydrolase [Mycobacteroides abscessus subsp. massiliense]